VVTARTAAAAAARVTAGEGAADAGDAGDRRATLLEVGGLHVELGDREVLAGVDVRVEAGEVVGLIGPNGAGKSTLLRAATGAIPRTAGDVRVIARPLETFSRRGLARAIAVVQQLPEAPPALRVRELVLLGRHPHLGLLARESGRDRAIAEEAMRRAGCDELADRTLGTLSGGQRRRAFIARALAQEPRLLLLDEPTSNLDASAQGEIFEVVRELAAAGVGVLVVVHDLTLAATYCDRLVLLHGGRVVAAGVPSGVLTAEVIRSVYGERVAVIRHPVTGQPLVVPSRLERAP
jgi:ABC-type cobalamin/Fe3+-siderophores transport system ATPase subunit